MINTSTINAIVEQSDQNRSSFAGVIPACVRTIDEMIAIHAMADPETPAVVFNGQVVSYGELDRRSNQLANYLTNLGVEAETIVAICLDRSPESVISSLAVLKAGGAYLPLDPKLPLERLRFMLNDAKPRVLITNSEFAEEIAGESCAVVAI
ncbi:MAG TPA: AMP-binding protein, partial [Pyrinomonadaceae bacterium]